MSDHDIAVSVRGLSKSYTISHNTNKATTLGEAVMGMLKPSRAKKSASETFWALRDVEFDIKKGDVVGIIGRNGAGKSTLLKILSRITEPTTGQIDIYGRVGSLLEVGTGFHPELTGRENIFMNGAILGMSKREITRHFDDIVEFAEVEQFLDTPVKRYSSGMYVRLAFAVAAHLNPEILIVDEVLAVGDAAFQKKCLGKMQDVSQQEGRTILFVSHNMAAIRALCDRGLFMKNGQLMVDSDIETATGYYLRSDGEAHEGRIDWDLTTAPQAEELRLVKAAVFNEEGNITAYIDNRKPFSILLEYEILKTLPGLRVGFGLQNSQGLLVCGSNDPDAWLEPERGPGFYTSRCTFPGYVLNSGFYSINFGADTHGPRGTLIDSPFCLSFQVEDVEGHGPMHEKLPGILRPKLEWEVRQTALI
jgi:lipopolysaccharide transport system ATP-binding protein